MYSIFSLFLCLHVEFGAFRWVEVESSHSFAVAVLTVINKSKCSESPEIIHGM